MHSLLFYNCRLSHDLLFSNVIKYTNYSRIDYRPTSNKVKNSWAVYYVMLFFVLHYI